MKLLMQTCGFLLIVFAGWGVSDVLHLLLGRWKCRFYTVMNAGLSLAVVSLLLTAIVWGAVSG